MRQRLTNIESAIRRLTDHCIDNPVAVNVIPITPASTLYSNEAAIVKNAVDKRKNEFCCGRNLFRLLLDTYNFPSCEILRGNLGQPLLPDNFIGSISHDEAVVAGVLMRKGLSIKAIGIDIVGPSSHVGYDLMPSFSSDEEIHRLFTKKTTLSPLKVIFSVKESVIKILSPLLQTYISPQDIILANSRQKILARYKHKPDLLIQAHWSESEGFIVSLATMYSTWRAVESSIRQSKAP